MALNITLWVVSIGRGLNQIIIKNLKFKKMKIELKQVKYYKRLSEETNCFTAYVYIDGIKCASAENRGYGGNTDIRPLDIKYKEIVKQAEEFCKTLPPYVFSDGDTMPYRLDTLVDELLEKYLDEKHKEKQDKKMQKLFNDAIVIGNDVEYFSLKLEKPLSFYIDNSNILTFQIFLKKLITEKLKKYEAKNYRLLNTNIPKSIFN
jgi:hypothetical protein